MKALKYIAFILLILFIGLSIFIAVQPNAFDFNRSRLIKAPVSLVFDKVNDYKSWPEFSPWIEQEPNATLTYLEKTSGEDAGYGWEGEILGIGNMETISVDKNKAINQKINFIKPFESNSDINWAFEETAEGTKVTWAMSGKQDFITKAYTAFMGSIEENTAKDFNRGLFKLDSIIQVDMKRYSVAIDGITEYGGGFYMYKTTSANSKNISKVMAKQYGEIMKYMSQNGVVQAGMPFTIYNEMNSENGNVIMSQAIPIQNKVDVLGDSQILCGYIPKTKALKITLKGNYTYLSNAWKKARSLLSKNNLEQSDIKPFEIYQTDPGNYPNPADWITEIYIPLK